MSLTINTGLTTSDGGTVDSGAYVIFNTDFPAGEFFYNVNMTIYRSEQAYIDGLRPIRGVQELPRTSFQKEVTVSGFTGLTPFVIHEEVKAHIENSTGAGTVTINPYS